uniref:Uncharacterized protein n=1 Tax=Picea glauca TaxID=3330 RepID=A0A101M4P5_PICGL|nr:hypothetical protein ABT39_MTgene895 [Picea glauca]
MHWLAYKNNRPTIIIRDPNIVRCIGSPASNTHSIQLFRSFNKERWGIGPVIIGSMGTSNQSISLNLDYNGKHVSLL